MSAPAAVMAIVFLVPLGVLALLGYQLLVFAVRGEAVPGVVRSVTTRDSIDDEGQPVQRYRAKVAYMAAGVERWVEDKGAIEASPAVGSRVTVRYLRAAPDTAIVWLTGQVWWIALPFAFCLAIELRALQLWLG